MADRSRRLSLVDATAVVVGALLGVGVLYIPKRIENHAGPAAPLAVFLAVLVGLSLVVGYAVYLSSSLGGRSGGAYLHLSRTWRSRLVGFLVVWPKPAAYVGLLGLLASYLGRVLATALPLAVPAPAVGVGVLGVVFALHLAGPSVVGRVGTVATAALAVGVALVVVPGLFAIVPGNYQPLFPTRTLADDPSGAIRAGAFVALFAIVGFDVAAGVARETADSRRAVPRALLGGVAVAGLLATLAALVTLGIIPWSRMVFATAPVVDVAQSLYGVPATQLLPPAAALAAFAALLALSWAPTRTLHGFGELVPPLAHTNRVGTPDVAAACVFGTAATLVFLDVVWMALFLALPAILVTYLCHALTTAALPLVRPDIYETCTFRPPARVTVAVGLVGAAVAGVMLSWSLAVDAAFALSYTRLAPLIVGNVASPLIRDPTGSVVPALLAWETLGVLVYIAAGDYRAATGGKLEPLTRL